MASLADNVARVIKVFGDIKTAIIERGVSVENNTPVEEYPDKIRDVSLTNYNQGLEDGLLSGEADGRQAQYDEFWDEFQQNGKRKDYRFAFGCGWNSKTFKPKYPIIPKDVYAFQNTAHQMFSYIGQSENKYVDLFEYPLDLTKVTQATETFKNAFLENIYVDVTDIQTSKLFDGSDMDRGSHPFKNVTIKCSANTTFSNSFWYANFDKLFFTEDSVIAQSGIDLKWATSLKSSKESFVNIINTLSNTTTGLSITFNQNAVNTAFETSEGAADGSASDEWTNLVASRSNWTIALAIV